MRLAAILILLVTILGSLCGHSCAHANPGDSDGYARPNVDTDSAPSNRHARANLDPNPVTDQYACSHANVRPRTDNSANRGNHV